MIETLETQSAKMPWERSAPPQAMPLPALSAVPSLTRSTEIERTEVTLGRPHLLEIAMEQRWAFSNLTPDVAAALRAGILQPQQQAVSEGRASAVSLAALHLQCGDIQSARTALESARPGDYWTEYMRAVTFWQAGELGVAEDILRSVAKGNPDDPRPLHALGKLLTDQNKFADALVLLRGAHSLDPESPPVLNDLAAVLVALHQPREALKVLRVAIRLAPTYSLALANCGVAHHQLKHMNKAIDFFKRALAVDERCTVAVHNLAECFLARQQWDSAGAILRRQIERVPLDARAHELLAWAHLCSNQIRDAQRILEQGSKLRGNRDPGLLNNLATVYETLNEGAKAQEAFQAAILLAPENSLIRANFAHLLANRNAWHSVVDVLRPQDVDGVPDRAALRARALLETSRVEEAIDVLRVAVGRFPEEPRFVSMLGNALASRVSRPLEAIEVYREALKVHDDDLLANNLGYALLLAEDFVEARKVLEPVFLRQRDKSDTTALCAIASMGLLTIREGRYEDGIELYREAHRRAVGPIKQRLKQKILVEEGRHFAELGNIDRARKSLRAAAEGKDPEFQAQAERLLHAISD